MTDRWVKGSQAQPYANVVAHVAVTIKGGAGKTETADVLEAVHRLAGSTCICIDIDDGNRGWRRRIGGDSIVKVDWTNGASDAAPWLDRHAPVSGAMIFDLGAGISSSDTSVMAFLSAVWRMLHDGGARLMFHCVVSTNAPTARFVERIVNTYGRLGKVAIVLNDKDGSGNFPAELFDLPEPRLKLGHMQPGIQAVRLSRIAPLSAIIADPSPSYTMATAMMATRVLSFAAQLKATGFIDIQAQALPESIVKRIPGLMYSVRRAKDATDVRLRQNAELRVAHDVLIAGDLPDAELATAAGKYRKAHAAWRFV